MQILIGDAWLILLHYVERSRGQCNAPSDLVIVFSQTSLLALSHTRPGGQLSWLLGRVDGLLISQTIIRAEAVYHGVCSQQGPSVSNGPWYGAPLHLSFSPPHLKHHRSPHHPSLVPGAALSGAVPLLLCCQHWNMFLTGVALLMSRSSVLSETSVTLVTAVWKQGRAYRMTSDIFVLSILELASETRQGIIFSLSLFKS